MPKMVANVKLPYGKAVYRPGEELDVSDRHAELFLKIGKARWPEGASPNASDLPVEVMGRASKREPITEVVEEVAPEAVEDEAPKQKRAYRRRDMTAEYGLTGAYKPSES